ncbi:MAG: hypothetical protein N3B10_03775 [Armatimonadetes bacterium]|nr:hypothetical protein [Armatimonadota bacterium]MCX7967594.1 hypothetical protein [Armatimonadota bacterium]MDW8144183.1 hypothetical protein [Armatimonadota bacterium]
MQKTRLVASAFAVWFASCFSLPLKFHLYFVLFSPKSLSDGQYSMVFPAAVACGITSGLVLAALTIVLNKRKPHFNRIAIWVALSYAAFWAIITTACEAIFVGKSWLGGGLIMTVVFMTIGMPVSLLFIIWLVLFPFSLVSGLLTLSPLLGALLLAFYFTHLCGWKGEMVAD